MWPRRSQEEEEHTLTELLNIDWRETSFVSRGDNPPARIVLWKQEPGLTDEEIEEILDEMEEGTVTTKTFTKRSDVVAEANRRAEELRKQDPEQYGRYSLDALRSQIYATDEALREALYALAPEEPAVVHEPVMKGADILAEHAREAEKLMSDPRVMEVPEHQRMAKARQLAWDQRDLRDRYQRAVLS
jgi:hypothetical protein